MIRVITKGIPETTRFFENYRRKLPQAMRRADERIARSMQMKAKHIVETETTAHTGALRSDIRILPLGKISYKVVAGRYAPHAWWIEHGRRAMVGYRFIPTQQYPLEGVSVPAQGTAIRAAKGIHFMERGTEHARAKAVSIVRNELRKLKGG